jgi:hypothetical protein
LFINYPGQNCEFSQHSGWGFVSAVVYEQPLDAGSSDVSMTDIYIIQDNNENSSNEPILSRDAAMDVRRMRRVLK